MFLRIVFSQFFIAKLLYNKRYASNNRIVFIRRAQEPTLEDNVVDLWQDLPASMKNLNTFTFPCEEEFLLKTQSSKSNYANDSLYMCAFFFVGFDVCVCYFFPYSRYMLYNYPSLA